MGFMLKVVGADPADFTDDEWGDAIDELEEVVDNGQVRRFTGNDYVDDLDKGDLVACEAWSGDVIAMQYDNPDIKWVVPEEGLSLWSDNMLVPNKADHKANAEALMNYYYDPEVAAHAGGLGQLHLPGRRAPARRWRRSTRSLVDAAADLPRRGVPGADVLVHVARRRDRQAVRHRLLQAIG